jgi:hypothetical protein
VPGVRKPAAVLAHNSAVAQVAPFLVQGQVMVAQADQACGVAQAVAEAVHCPAATRNARAVQADRMARSSAEVVEQPARRTAAPLGTAVVVISVYVAKAAVAEARRIPGLAVLVAMAARRLAEVAVEALVRQREVQEALVALVSVVCGTRRQSENNMKITSGKWEVQDMTLNPAKVMYMWELLQRHRTLFSDLTWGDIDNFVRAIASTNTLWFEVREHDVVVGIIWFDDMHLVTDTLAHMVFFDRMPVEKLEVCNQVIKWMFTKFPIQRITVTPPAIYFMTIKLLRRLGFTQDGCKRQAVLIGGEWKDILIFGITREEVNAL